VSHDPLLISLLIIINVKKSCDAYYFCGNREKKGFFDEYKVQKNGIYFKYNSFVTVFTVSFDQFNASFLLTKRIHLFQKLLNVSLFSFQIAKELD